MNNRIVMFASISWLRSLHTRLLGRPSFFFVCVFDAQAPASTSLVSKRDLEGTISSLGQCPNKVWLRRCVSSPLEVKMVGSLVVPTALLLRTDTP